LPLTDAQKPISEAFVEKLLHFMIKGAQLTFGGIKALSLRRLQEYIHTLADKGYTVAGTILRPHETTAVAQIGTYFPFETRGNKLPVIAQID